MYTKKYLFKLYYIASKQFFGSQRQKVNITIEECLIDTLIDKNYIKDAESSKFEVASRTDRFVSARGAALSFVSLKKPILMEINSALPREIGLWAHALVQNDFLSRYNAIYRHYKYFLPIRKGGSYKDEKLNFKLMKKACRELEGRHDFTNFYKKGKEEVKTVRDILLASLRKENNFIIFDFKSRAFLRQQIRRMIAIILEIGKGKIDYAEYLNLFNPSITVSYQPADPRGLILWDVKYDETIRFINDTKSIERMNDFFLKQEIKYSYKNKLFSIMQHNNVS